MNFVKIMTKSQLKLDKSAQYTGVFWGQATFCQSERLSLRNGGYLQFGQKYLLKIKACLMVTDLRASWHMSNFLGLKRSMNKKTFEWYRWFVSKTVFIHWQNSDKLKPARTFGMFTLLVLTSPHRKCTDVQCSPLGFKRFCLCNLRLWNLCLNFSSKVA